MRIVAARSMVVAGVFIALLALFGLYSTGFGAKLIFDDVWVVRNPELLTSSIELRLAFRSLWLASYQFIYQFVGSELYWQRVFNVVVHILNTLLLWRLSLCLALRALEQEGVVQAGVEGDRSNSERGATVGVVVGVVVLLWAFNPVAVYAVQYLTQRSTLMATLFVMASLLAFIRLLQSRNIGARILWGVICLGAYILAVMAKEHAAPGIALLLPVYVYWGRPNVRRLLGGVAVFGVLAVAFGVLMVMRKGWTIGSATEDMVGSFLAQLEVLRPGSSEQVYLLSLVNQLWLFLRYGAIWVVPWIGWMSVDIRPPFPLVWYAFPQIIGGVVFVMLVAGGVWLLLARKGKAALIGLGIVAAALMYTTELAYVRLQEPFVLYRSYLWSFALPWLWAALLLSLAWGWQHVVAGGVFLAIVCGALSHDRIQSLRDEGAAWLDAFNKINVEGPVNALGRWRAALNLSRWYLVKGQYQDAFRYAQLADRLGAPSGTGKFNMASVMLALNRGQQAFALLDAAERDGYKGAELMVSKAVALEQLGRGAEAFTFYDRAFAENLEEKYRPQALVQAGRLANRVGRYDRALEYYGELQRLRPGSVEVILGMSYAYHRLGAHDKALSILTNAIEVNKNPMLYHARSQVWMGLGNVEQASRDIAEALRLDPKNPTYEAAEKEILSRRGGR